MESKSYINSYGEDTYSYHSPRIFQLVSVWNTNQCKKFRPTVEDSPCIGTASQVYMGVIDTEKEAAIGVGRAWTLPPLGISKLFFPFWHFFLLKFFF